MRTACFASMRIKSVIKHRNRIGDGFFVGFLAVFIDLSLVLFAVRKASRAADTAADTRHAFNEVGIPDLFSQTEKRDAALLDPVAGNCIQLEIVAVFLYSFCDSVGKPAASCENAARNMRRCQEPLPPST